MRTSIATISVGGTLDLKLSSMARAGFDGVEIMDADLVASDLSPAQIGARCRDLGLAVEILQPVRDVVGIDPAGFPAALRRMRHRLGWARELGTDRVLLCSTVGPQAVDDADLLAEQLAEVARAADEAGIVVAYEALAWGTCVNRVGQAWSAVRAVDHPSLGLGIDTFHISAVGDDAGALAGIPGSAMAFLQIADAPHLQMSALEWSRHHRCFPGQGALDLVGLVGAVLDAGYAGPLSLEVFSDLVREADPLLTARDAHRSLLFLQDALRTRDASPASDDAAAEDGRAPHPDLARLAPAAADPVPVGVTLAAPPGSRVVDVLRAIGFEDDGPAADAAGTGTTDAEGSAPPESPVGRMRRGGTRVDVVATDRALAPAALPRLRLAVADPASLVERARALAWPVRDDAGDPVLVTPAGLQVTLETADRGDANRGTGALPGIDHVGTAVPPNDSDAEVSFYRQLFAMSTGPISEFADPTGRLRSRALLGGGDAPLRMVLNIAVGSGTAGTPAGPGLNQLAVATDDLLAQVPAMRAAGAPLLRPPASYYDDLDARFDLDPALLAALREHGVFYDRDGDGGELLHVYTPVVDGAFYLEVLQRRGGYAGWGAAATPVRLALQAAAR